MRWRWIGVGAIVLMALGAGALFADGGGRPSTCLGRPGHGGLRDGWKLPRSGDNFRAYSDVGWVAGRTYVHSRVHALVLEAYAKLARALPQQRFVYGETGWESGGPIPPHRTHQNGLSVDFMVPVRDAEGAPAELPTIAANKYGYGVELDADGRGDGFRIDFEAMAEHLAQLDAAAQKRGLRIARVIFDPKLRARLATTTRWDRIRHLPFSTRPAWVRHDEHYHVDFDVPCRPLGG